MIWILVKINFRALFAGMFRRYKGKKKIKPATAVLIGLLVLYVVGALGFTVGAMFHGLCGPLFEAGVGWFYFALAGIMVFALCFIGSVFMIQTQMFSARDNELLLSMPIRPLAILAGRLLALLAIEYIYAALIVVPVFAVLPMTGYISQIPALGIVFFFLSAALLPLFALAAGCLVGWIVALVSSRLRNKNLPTLVLSLAFLGAYLWFYTQMMNNINVLISNGAEIAAAVRRAVFPAYHLGVSISDGNLLSFLIFAVCAVAPFALVCALLSRSFVKSAAGGRGARKVKYREKTVRASGAGLALLRRELLHFWSQPMYILNASMGAIATVVLAAIMVVRPGLLLDPLEQAAAYIPALSPGHIGAIALSTLAAMNFVSAPSISLEGKRLWILKSLPVKSRDVLLSKAGMHLLVCGAPSLLAGAACIAAIPMSAAQMALTMITPISITVVFSLLGVTLNLAFPRFDWINPIQPVKQGLSGMLSMFGGMALIAALVVIYILLPGGRIALEQYLLICTVFFLAASGGLLAYISGPGGRKFEAL